MIDTLINKEIDYIPYDISPWGEIEFKLDENEKAEFIKKERFHAIGAFPKYDVNVALTGKNNFHPTKKKEDVCIKTAFILFKMIFH